MRWCVGVLLAASTCVAGCATTRGLANPGSAPPPLDGSYYVVQPGETLWRIAQAFGIDVEVLVARNDLPNAQELSPNQRLFIPIAGASDYFVWPMRGPVTTDDAIGGIAIAAPEGSLMRAARSGRVAVAAQELTGWGGTIIIDHGDQYVTVYANLAELLVAPDATVPQGLPLGRVGSIPAYFQIRRGWRPAETLSLLPEP